MTSPASRAASLPDSTTSGGGGSKGLGSRPVAASAAPAAAAAPTYDHTEPLGAAMEGWAYPFPVQHLQFELEGRPVRMAYMDVQPTVAPNGQTVVLFHGKNFGSDYWANTLRALPAKGYRVIAVDQIGFGKSSKPEIRYTFAMLADNTVRVLDHLKVGRVAIVANSMGGMLGVHFARRHPDRVAALVLENPLGLEDYVPAIPPQQTANLLKLEMAQTTTSYRAFIKSYFKDNYRADSGLIATMLMLEEMSRVGEPLSEIRRSYERYSSSGEINTQVEDPAIVIESVSQKFAAFPQDRLDGLTVDCGPWWFNLRPSNTEPLLRLNLEAPDRDECDNRVAELLAAITSV